MSEGHERVSAPAGARVKQEYGPSLAQLLGPRWRAASRVARVSVLASAVLLVAIVALAGLTLENASYSHGGSVRFGFEYRDLFRTTPEADGYVRVQSRFEDGELKYSYAVDPISLPAYAGAVQGVLPLYATGYIRSLTRRYPHFALRGEGKTKVNNTLIGYQVAFTGDVQGRAMYGRFVMFTPPTPHPRGGVVVAILAAPEADESVHGPLEIAQTGALLRPLKTFAFG